MENWKGKVGNVFQKVNSAGRNFLSTFRPEVERPKDLEKSKSLQYNALQYFGDRFGDDDIEIDPCVDCDREFGILAIEGESGNSDFDDLERRNDREEIRRKLAMDSDNEDYVAENLVQNQESNSIDRLKGGSNLQICFMNEAAKETEVVAETDSTVERAEPSIVKVRKPLPKILMTNLLFPPILQRSPGSSKVQNNNTQPHVVKRHRPTFFFNRPRSWHAAKVEEKPVTEEDLFTRHHRLQAEAREALTQAKDMARMQMEIERQKKKKSPIADIVGISFPDGQNSLSRHALLDMNVAQLQVIVNDLHSQIETLNENLVKFLLERDDLHMEQDSMLVDIEDLTRYLGLKGGSSVSHSMDSKLPLNVEVSSSIGKPLDPEPVRRSQSVHLKKPRNFV